MAVDVAKALSELDLFMGLSEHGMHELIAAGRHCTFAPGEAAVAQGDEFADEEAAAASSIEMHVILEGVCKVVIDGTAVRDLTAGEYFGELSVIDGLPRSADVLAGDSGLVTFALTKETFDKLMKDDPEIAVPMLRMLATRLRARRAEVGGLTKAFERMTNEVAARERELKEQVRKLTVNVDMSTAAEDAKLITESDFFTDLANRAKEIRMQLRLE
ncbi:MAG: cyclic nucleotide-binding domain-containing protein [Actinomycetes bacterium]|jgi:CRP-like cAMP-binding protein